MNRTRHEIILKEITRCARRGLPCPTNLDLSDLVGAESTSTAVRIIKDLEASGQIIVHRTGNNRTIDLPTGESTQGIVRVPSRVVVKIKREDGTPPEPVNRDPCGWCGTRADHGCHHSRRAA